MSSMTGKTSPPRRRPSKPANPLVKGTLEFCERRGIDVGIASGGGRDDVQGTLPGATLTDMTNTLEEPSSSQHVRPLSLTDLPKRFTSYSELLLLPVNFATGNWAWQTFYRSLSARDRAELFARIAEDGFGSPSLRIAITAPIALQTEADGDDTAQAEETEGAVGTGSVETQSTLANTNILRSPSGLAPVYGDWGPNLAPAQAQRRRGLDPNPEDFDAAFWTSTSQHPGITQCWAPLYTMFSRGNIREKGRILEKGFPGLSPTELGQDLDSVDVVDHYVGIGYFAFSYLARGVRRVYGFDLNPWSIEGLRRGCELNNWGCVVIKLVGHHIDHPGSVPGLVQHIVRYENTPRQVRCVAFLGDNQWAAKVLSQIQDEFAREPGNANRGVNPRHFNLGLLPTSRGSWDSAVEILATGKDAGWFHVHENVDVRQIDTYKEDVVNEFVHLLESRKSNDTRSWAARCVHVEQVKTYAPGVMHCVFDIEITSTNS